MNLFHKLIAKLEANNPVQPKAEEISVECPFCHRSFDVDVDSTSDNDDSDAWKTDDLAGDTGGEHDDANTGVGDNSEEFTNMYNPKSRHDAEQIIAQSLLKVSGERTNDPELPSITAARKAVEKHAKTAKSSAVDLLAEALKQAKKDQ